MDQRQKTQGEAFLAERTIWEIPPTQKEKEAQKIQQT